MFTKKLAFFLAAVMAAASLSLPAFAYDNLFSDVPEDAWEAPYVYDLVDRGILSGYGDGTFGPRITVKRCEYAKMLVSITNTPHQHQRLLALCGRAQLGMVFPLCEQLPFLYHGLHRGRRALFPAGVGRHP